MYLGEHLIDNDRQYFLLGLVAIICVTVVLNNLFTAAFDQATQSNKRRLVKLEACQTLFDQAAMVVCIEHA